MNYLKIFMCALGLVTSSLYAQVNYYLDINEPEHHLANVTIEAQVIKDKMVFQFPAWRTGKYRILNLANGVRDFKVVNENNQRLPWKKIDKSRWEISSGNNQKVKVTYQIYANQLKNRSRHIDDTHAFIDASGYFMYVEALRAQPVMVSLKIPESWQSISGMKSGTEPHQFLADNYDVLIDSPIEAGIYQHHTFSTNGVNFDLVIWGEGNYDANQMVTDLTKLVQQVGYIWDETPFNRYVFMVHATTDVRGATEHLNSTIIQRKRFSFFPRKEYLEFLATAAHEYVHTWNVKSYRPKGIAEYDYMQENYSPLLWLSEGSTSYLEYQLLLRAELMTVKEYLAILAKEILEHEQTPGRYQQSVSQASFDAWIDEFGDRGTNSSVNIYDEGSLVSLALDLTLLSESAGEVSYRQVHNELFKRHKLPASFNENDVKDILKDISGKDYDTWWIEHIEQPKALDFHGLLNNVGLKLNTNNQTIDLGLRLTEVNGLVKVKSVIKDSLAWQAGLTPNDIILTLNGLRLYPGTFDDRLAVLKEKKQLKVEFFRRDKIMTKMIVMPETESTQSYEIVPLDNVTSKQKDLFKAWLGVDFTKI